MEDFNLFKSNINAIRRDHNRRMNSLRRQGRREALLLCPIAVLLFAFFAWYNFSKGGDFGVGIVMIVGAVTFLILLFLSEIFNRPHKID